MSGETFTNRYVETQTVKRIEGPTTVTGSSGWTAACAPPELVERLRVGDEYGVETHGSSFGTICGFWFAGRWWNRKSDQQLDREHAEMVAGFERQRRESLDRNRADWTVRTAELPSWARDRIATFQERGGDQFELDGWGYELCVCELAVLYARFPDGNSRTKYDELPQEIRDYDHKRGCSGNQHDMAAALARAHRDGVALAGTVSALSPLTGSAFYEPAGAVGDNPKEAGE